MFTKSSFPKNELFVDTLLTDGPKKAKLDLLSPLALFSHSFFIRILSTQKKEITSCN